MEWLPLIFAVLGLALLASELWATQLNRRTSRALSKRTWVAYSTSTSVIGFLLVVASFYPEYYVRSDLRMLGVPFVTAALRFERGHWIDYTGFLTLPALVGNVAVAFLLPQLILAGLWRVMRVRP
jgi:hypothetical protein